MGQKNMQVRHVDLYEVQDMHLQPGDVIVAEGRTFIIVNPQSTVGVGVPMGYCPVVNLDTGELNVLPQDTIAEKCSSVRLDDMEGEYA